MPENDIFPLDPDFDVDVDETDGVLRQRAEGGRAIQWQQRPAQRIFTLSFKDRPTDDVEQLRDWKRRFAASFFVFHHKAWVNNAGTYVARKFPVEWADDSLPQRLVANEAYDFQIRLLEAVGRAYAAGTYPDPAAGHPSFFIEENDPAGVFNKINLPFLASNFYSHASRAEWGDWQISGEITFLYTGCGFRYWCIKDLNLGIVEVFLDGASLGTVDLYNATLLTSAARFTKLDVPLGLHRVKLKRTGTKNASSAGYLFYADALEVLP